MQLTPAGASTASSGLPESVAAAVRILLADLAQAPFSAPDAERLRKLGLDVRAIAAAARAGLLMRVSDQIVLAPGADDEGGQRPGHACRSRSRPRTPARPWAPPGGPPSRCWSTWTGRASPSGCPTTAARSAPASAPGVLAAVGGP